MFTFSKMTDISPHTYSSLSGLLVFTTNSVQKSLPKLHNVSCKTVLKVAYLSLVISVYLMLNNQHIPRLLQFCNGICMFCLQLFNDFLKIYNARISILYTVEKNKS